MDVRAEIKAVRAELTEIAQAYNAAGMSILKALHPGGYTSRARMPGTLRPLGDVHALLDGLVILEERLGGRAGR
jgi:hypothetical protein